MSGLVCQVATCLEGPFRGVSWVLPQFQGQDSWRMFNFDKTFKHHRNTWITMNHPSRWCWNHQKHQEKTHTLQVKNPPPSTSERFFLVAPLVILCCRSNQKSWQLLASSLMPNRVVSNTFHFHPDPWENGPIWRAYLSNRLVQPPIREVLQILQVVVLIPFESISIENFAPEVWQFAPEW